MKNNAHWRAFETVFEVYFSLRGKRTRSATTRDELSTCSTTMEPARACGQGEGRAVAAGARP